MNEAYVVPRTRRLSSYLFLAGLLPGKWGARAWTFWGIASLGIAWDRLTECRIGTFNYSQPDVRFALTHLPFGIAGAVRLWRHR